MEWSTCHNLFLRPPGGVPIFDGREGSFQAHGTILEQLCPRVSMHGIPARVLLVVLVVGVVVGCCSHWFGKERGTYAAVREDRAGWARYATICFVPFGVPNAQPTHRILSR